MRISLNTIKSYAKVPANVSDQELIQLIGSRLVEVEEVIDLAPRYKGVYVVKVLSAEPIPDTHLNLCRIDAGVKTAEFSKDGEDSIQIVCGAPNVHAGMLAVWITPGAIVPETYGNENFKLSVRKLRGYDSYGMLSGADELGLDTEHKSIAEIDPKMAKPGDDFAEVFGLNDIILDVENKSLTHRPDCFGLIGFAREVAGILGLPFTEPEVFSGTHLLKPSNAEMLEVKIEDDTLCPRYSCAIFDLPNNQPSKYLTLDTVFLAKAGMRAIDPIVDLTNILMLETGQPLHAFDYDKLVTVGQTKSPKIIVRAAKPEEQLQLLDGKTITCIPSDILITSNNIPVALAGAMGGKNTEVDASTKRIVLESATFSLYNLRKTQMAHGIFSEAITRFTKGQPAAMTLPVLSETVRRLAVEPLAVADAWPSKDVENVVKITTVEINNLLGTTYEHKQIVQTLENVGFSVKVDKDNLTVTAPAWRTDVHIKEDVIEEVGRLLGYDNITLTLPQKPFIESELDPMFSLKTELREILSDRLAMNELLTYSFVSRQLLEKVNEDPASSYEIVNSISPELQCFRQQIVPSLLDKVRENLKSGHEDFTLYEVNQVTLKSYGFDEDQTPILKTHLGIVCLGDFYTLKSKVLALFRDLHLPVEYMNLQAETAQHDAYLEPKRSAELSVAGQKLGAFGEVKTSVLKQFKLEQTVSALEINLEKLLNLPRQTKPELKISKFPFVERDLTLRVAAETPFGRIASAVQGSLDRSSLISTVTPLSIYQASPDDATKNLSFHLKFSDPAKTLNSEEISAIMEQIAEELAGVGATIV